MIKDKWIYIFTVCVAIFLGSIIMKSTIEKVITLNKDIQKTKKTIQDLGDKAQQLAAIDENELKRKVQLVEEIFPSYRPVLELINALQQLSLSQNVVFKGVELFPGKLEDQGDSSRHEFSITFSIQGELAQINAFINELKRTPPPMKIETLDLRIIQNNVLEKTKQATESSSQITASLTIIVYYQPIPEDIGAIDRPLAQLSNDERETLKKLSSFNSYPKMQSQTFMGKEDLFALPLKKE